MDDVDITGDQDEFNVFVSVGDDAQYGNKNVVAFQIVATDLTFKKLTFRSTTHTFSDVIDCSEILKSTSTAEFSFDANSLRMEVRADSQDLENDLENPVESPSSNTMPSQLMIEVTGSASGITHSLAILMAILVTKLMW